MTARNVCEVFVDLSRSPAVAGSTPLGCRKGTLWVHPEWVYAIALGSGDEIMGGNKRKLPDQP
jgi:hypothetical protein